MGEPNLNQTLWLMRKSISLYFIFTILLFNACEKQKSNEEDLSAMNSTQVSYASEGYENRDSGSDWVGLNLSMEEKRLFVSIRSRADIKKPTCTADFIAYLVSEGKYEAVLNGAPILIGVTDNEVTIKPKNTSKEGDLSFFCSGGASIAGSYSKIEGQLDQEQVDPALYSKVLMLQGIGFNVSSIKEAGANVLKVFTFGLQESEFNETIQIDEFTVYDAEVEDLNSDGSPELIVFAKGEEPNQKGTVYAFSVNNKKSMSMVYFQPTEENNQINKGYSGFDEFTIMETKLAQRFPIYQEDDSLEEPSGGMRQVTYRLVDGEAMRKFEVDKTSKY